MCPTCAVVLRGSHDRGGNTFGGHRLWSDGVIESARLAPDEHRGRRCGACNTALWLDDLARFDDAFDDDDPRIVIHKVGPQRFEMLKAIRTATGCGLEEVLALEAQVPVAIRAPAPRLGTLLVDLRASGAEVEARGTFAGGPQRPRIVDLEPLATEDYETLIGGTSPPARELRVRLEAWRRHNARFRAGGTAWHRHQVWPVVEQANAARLFDLLGVDQPADRLLKAEIARQLERFDECRELVAPLLDSAHQAIAEQFLELIRHRRPDLCVLR